MPGGQRRKRHVPASRIAGYCDLSGKQLSGNQVRGTVIVRYTDGTTRKAVVKEAR